MNTKLHESVLLAGRYLQHHCHEASVDAGWWGERLLAEANQPTDASQVRVGTRLGKALVAQKLMLIVSEVAEAMEGHRKDKMDPHLPHRKNVEVELADAVIRIADLAGALGLDLGGAIAEKMAYNAVRPDHKLEARMAAGGKAY